MSNNSSINLQKIGIIGSGAMGNGIAQVCATAGCEVSVYDRDPAALERAAQQLDTALQKRVSRGKATAAEADRIRQQVQYVDDLSAMRDCEMLIEAVVEDLAVKKELFATLEGLVDRACLLASNTSSLSIASIAAACRHPDRVIGIHFFNPAPVMALVEIIPAVQTRPGLAVAVRQWVEQIGKLPVVAKDTPGFIVNRIARPFYGEAIRIFDEGIADAETIDAAMVQIGGFRMGPFELMDFIGHDVNYRVTESVFESFFYDPRYKPSLTQRRLFEAGYYGRKSGRGFYSYTADGSKVVPPAAVHAPASSSLQEEVFNRILAMLINEAADALLYGIGSKEDLDLAMTRGVNYPKGLLAWADEVGIGRIQQTMDDLYDFYREDRYRLSPLLRRMAKAGETFYP